MTTGDELREVAGGFGFLESPRWHEGRLWVSDFFDGRVSSLGGDDGDRRTELVIDDRPSGLGWLPDGRLLVVSMRKRLVLRREHDGSVEVHADLSRLAPCDCNDMVVAADGTAYVGNFGSDILAREPRRDTCLVAVRPDGEARVVADGLSFPNGSVITPDDRTLIVGESFAQRYRAFAIGSDGSLGGGRVWAEMPGRSPDGCTLDAEGAIWFADASGREVVRVVEGGRIDAVLELPDTPYACALGGADGATLFIVTSATTPRPDAPTDTARIWATRVAVAHAGRP
jgi:sugar lactone lactonase YvrE